MKAESPKAWPVARARSPQTPRGSGCCARPGSPVVAALLGLALAAGAAGAHAQQLPDTLVAGRLMASRSALDELQRQLQARPSDARTADLLARVRGRLIDGDFRAGDRVWLEVQGEPALSDTFEVGPGRELRLPTPVVGIMPLQGVLRSELEPCVTRFLSRFLANAVVRARPLIRLSIQGEVARGGIHLVPADAPLSDAISAAGGTTATADLRRLRIERSGETILRGDAVEQAFSAGRTIGEANLQNGDRVIVDRRRDATLESNLRFLWVFVSLAGGIYSLSRLF